MEDDIMAITGIGGTYGNVYGGGYISSQKEVTEKAKVVKSRRKKAFPQGHYQKRKRLREQFEEQMAKKDCLQEYLKGRMAEEEKQEVLLKKNILLKEQNTARFIERYEADILREAVKNFVSMGKNLF